MLKTITLKIVLPKWAKFVATDKGGAVWAFALEPTRENLEWMPSHWGKMFQVIGHTVPPKDWRKTLRRIR